jgi:CheY-like chemotaxis protein
MARTKRTVLVVEDSSDDAGLIRLAFCKAGFEHLFRTVESIDEGRRYLTGEGQYGDREKFPQPDLVVLDHQMPGDGMGILRWARGQPALAALPMVVFSGSDNPGHRQSSLEAGANAYYNKPVNFERFVASVKGMIEAWVPGLVKT